MAEQHGLDVDGVRTAWLEAGEGPVLLLLHGGAWGESAATTWGGVLDRLAVGRRVLAPDWLGFGGSAKLRDFADLQGRMLDVLVRWLAAVGVTAADAVGLSMGGANLLRDQTSASPRLALRRMVLVSAGGAPLAGEARARLADYDGSVASMRRQVALACADPRLAADDDVVLARHAASLVPGAFEVMASLGLRSPAAAPPPPGDPLAYERVRVPTLLLTGGADRLKPPGFADDAARRLPDAVLTVLPGAGHCVQLDDPDGFCAAVEAFLSGSSSDDAPRQPVAGDAAAPQEVPA